MWLYSKGYPLCKKLLNGRKVLPYGTVWVTDVYPKDKCDKAPVPPKDPKEVIKKGTTGSHFAAESCKVIYIIDENGDLQMPIVTSTCIPTYDQYIISRIRTLTKKWTPGMVQGKNVSVMVRDSFSVDGAIK